MEGNPIEFLTLVESKTSVDRVVNAYLRQGYHVYSMTPLCTGITIVIVVILYTTKSE